MTLAVFIGLLLIGLAASCHYGVLSLSRIYCQTRRMSRFMRLLVTLYGAVAGHLVAAGLFAFGFSLGHALGLGEFERTDLMTAMDYFYFSLVNMTTLGLGQIYPTDHLRFLAGIEAMTGFLLISLSASFIFRETKSDDS
ncbi:MAG: two pore domain potassium channel family protein [Sphingomonadaceae bacterium]|nr:two pore domain potassium channel family protein [Sphingomonadaceae bacterium]